MSTSTPPPVLNLSEVASVLKVAPDDVQVTCRRAGVQPCSAPGEAPLYNLSDIQSLLDRLADHDRLFNDLEVTLALGLTSPYSRKLLADAGITPIYGVGRNAMYRASEVEKFALMRRGSSSERERQARAQRELKVAEVRSRFNSQIKALQDERELEIARIRAEVQP